MAVSRKVAQQKHSQVPTNLFNPMTDQMTAIVGHKEETVQQSYMTNPNPKSAMAMIASQKTRQNVLVKEL